MVLFTMLAGMYPFGAPESGENVQVIVQVRQARAAASSGPRARDAAPARLSLPKRSARRGRSAVQRHHAGVPRTPTAAGRSQCRTVPFALPSCPQRIKTGTWQMPADVELSPNCWDLLKGILLVDPTRRISMRELMAHPWFRQNLPAGERERELC